MAFIQWSARDASDGRREDDERRSSRGHVWEAMSTKLVTATPNEPVGAVARRARELGLHHVIVIHRSGALSGMICGCDMERAWPDALVADCMSACTLFTGPAESLAVAAETMERYGIGALPVLAADGRPVGVVTRSDLRHRGALPDKRGIDRCVCCGSGHSLKPRGANEVCICVTCAERAHEPPEDVELGDGD